MKDGTLEAKMLNLRPSWLNVTNNQGALWLQVYATNSRFEFDIFFFFFNLNYFNDILTIWPQARAAVHSKFVLKTQIQTDYYWLIDWLNS